MEPGASKPRPGGDPTAPMSDADVEKTLNTLESMTSTLVKEVGTPPKVEDAPTSAQTQSQTAPAATNAPARNMPAQATPPRNATPAADPSAPATAPTPADPTGAARATARGTEPSAPPAPTDQAPSAPASAQAEPVTAPAEAKSEPAASADAEVEQEISQAIRQLQAGQPVPAATTTTPAAAAPASTSITRRVLRGLTRAAGAILSPLALLALLLDLPFRWMPAALKHLLGYVAIGTALMAAAFWYYIIAIRPH